MEYEFRAWDKINKKMIYDFYSELCSDSMQLAMEDKDKNNNKIFVDDIVKVEDDPIKYGCVAGTIGVVKLSKGAFRIQTNPQIESIYAHIIEDTSIISVIGNIYENFEFLEGKIKINSELEE